MSALAIGLEPQAGDVKEKRPNEPETILKSRFGLTAAEARVACHLAEGLSYLGVAERLGVSPFGMTANAWTVAPAPGFVPPLRLAP